MLKSLSIRNVALIESADLEFSNGLNVLSGETGSGKSVILECIDFVLGAKADKGMVRYGESECLVRAEFTVEDPAVYALLREMDIEAEDTIVISRKLSSDGRGTLKLNGCPATAAMVRRITSLLVDVHGQSEHFFLLKESNQLRLLDAIGGEPVARAKEEVAVRLSARKGILNALKALGGDEGERSRRLDILRFQIEELQRADLREGEEAELLLSREKFRNAEKIENGLSEARESLLADGGCLDGVRNASRAFRALAKYSKNYAAIAERLENSASELEDIGEEVEAALDGLDVNEREAERVENRLDELGTLKKKYGGSVLSAIEYLGKAREECSLLENSAERYEELSNELKTADDALFRACEKLTKARKDAADGFCKRVTGELSTLNIGSAKFEIEFAEYTRDDVDRATAEGIGGVKFLFSANKGEPPKELGKIISGGEMSRFMLAVKAQMSDVNGIGTYIFDEIDAGIGGNTAKAVGEKFCKISKNTQIIAVSHLARIVAFADKNFFIEKTENGGRTCTHIHLLEGEARLGEIARLIGGNTGEIAMLHAQELLGEAESYKKSL